MKKTGGFTLIEMLIVVAIIAILIAVSIPLVSSSLDKARKSTDAANERAAKAAALAQYMLDRKTGDQPYTYDAASGKAKEGTTAPATSYGQCSDHKGGYVVVKVSGTTGEAEVKWHKGGSPMPDDGGKLDSDALIKENTGTSSTP